MIRRRLIAALSASAALAAGCTVGPDYRRPDGPTAPAFAALAGKDQGAVLSATTGDEADLALWWTQFHDPMLDRLVERALQGNLDLAEAASRIRQARAQVVVTQAAGLPQVAAVGNALRDNRSASADSPLGGLVGAGAASGGSSGAAAGGAAQGASSSSSGQGPSHVNYYTVGLDATWMVDLFGGVRRGVEGARDSAAAQVWSRRDSQVAVASEVANQYLQLRLQQSRLSVLHADLDRQEGLFRIIRDRFATGFVTNLDVNQQRAQLANTQAQIPQAEAQADAAIHAIGVLLGETPEAMAAELGPSKGALPPVPPRLPAGLPSDLLRRRPDIRAAERSLAAANAQIGVQTAALYPSFDILALGSFGAGDIERLFDGRNAMSLGLGLVQWNAFTAGRNQANVRIAREQYQQSLVQYRRTVLTAYRDVEDALSRYGADQRRWSALSGSFGASQNSYTIARQQYGVGLVDYTSVYNAQATLLQVQDQLTQADGALATDVVALYRALGGGWRVDPALDGDVGAGEASDPVRRRAKG